MPDNKKKRRNNLEIPAYNNNVFLRKPLCFAEYIGFHRRTLFITRFDKHYIMWYNIFVFLYIVVKY